MKDEEEGLIDVPLSNKSDIHIFYVIPLRFPTKFELSLFNWKKLLIVTWGIQTMFFMALSGLMKPSWDSFTKSMIIIAVVSPFFGYLMVLLNMFNGGWGREESRFWCHIRIMYLEGYNSMRWIIASIIDPAMVIANCTIQGEDIPSAFWSGISVVYCYYILSSIEFNKRQPIEWDKYKNDFDVKLKTVHNIQEKNVKSVNINAIALCICLTILPWACTGWNLGFIIMLYQIIMCINAYRYATSNQTFVVTDVQYDIIQLVFRIIITWTFIWIC